MTTATHTRLSADAEHALEELADFWLLPDPNEINEDAATATIERIADELSRLARLRRVIEAGDEPWAALASWRARLEELYAFFADDGGELAAGTAELLAHMESV